MHACIVSHFSCVTGLERNYSHHAKLVLFCYYKCGSMLLKLFGTDRVDSYEPLSSSGALLGLRQLTPLPLQYLEVACWVM